MLLAVIPRLFKRKHIAFLVFEVNRYQWEVYLHPSKVGVVIALELSQILAEKIDLLLCGILVEVDELSLQINFVVFHLVHLSASVQFYLLEVVDQTTRNQLSAKQLELG